MSAPAATSARTRSGRDRGRVGCGHDEPVVRRPPRRPRPATERAAATSAVGRGARQPDVHAAPGGQRPAQPGRRIDPQQPAADERHPVAQPVRLVEVVRREDDRPAGPPQRLDRLADDVGRLRVERRRRLVEEDDRRVVEQGPGDGQLLLHALAERAGDVVAPVPQREQPQVPLDPLGARRGVQPVQPPEEVEVGRRRQLVVEARRLGQDADPGADLLGVLDDVEAVDRGAALARLDERGQQPDRRRLARAVRPEQAEHLAAEHLEVHPADRPQVAEPPAQTGRAEHDGVGRGHRPQSDRPCHNRPVTRPWTLPEVTGTGRLPMHSVEHLERLPLDGRWRFQLLRTPDGVRRHRLVRGGRPGPLDDGRDLGPAPLHERADALRGPAAGDPGAQPDGRLRARVRDPGVWAGRRIVLHVGAAESVLIVSLNGDEVGTGKDSHLASEFDLTDRLRPGSNTLTPARGQVVGRDLRRGPGPVVARRDHADRSSCTRPATSTSPMCGSMPAWPTTCRPARST